MFSSDKLCRLDCLRAGLYDVEELFFRCDSFSQLDLRWLAEGSCRQTVFVARDVCVRGDLKMPPAMIGRFRSLDGFVEVTQGLLLDSSISWLGRARHTCAGNILFGLGYFLIAAVSTAVYPFCRSAQQRMPHLDLVGFAFR